MNLPVTTEAATDRVQDQAAIDALLGAEGAPVEVPAAEVQAEEPAARETTEPAEVVSEEAEAAEPAEAADEAEAAAEPEAESEEESELSLDEGDRDYSQAAYEKAAKHYSRTHAIQLNPDDPAHRALLKEVMDRGRALTDQKAREEAEKPKADEAKAAEEAKTAPARPTPEQIREGITKIQEIAKQRVIPEVAMHVTSRFVKALWPGEDVKISQEQANDFAAGLHEFFLMAMDDVAPALLGMVNQGLSSDPVWGTVQAQAIDSSAFEHLDRTLGAERFADMEKLVDDGTLKSIMDKNPNIFKGITAGDGRNPVLNRAAQLEAAYKFARGEKTLDQVTRAVATGKKQATDTAKKVAASRVAPGTPKGGFSQPASESERLIKDLTSGGGSRFSEAVNSQLKRS